MQGVTSFRHSVAIALTRSFAPKRRIPFVRCSSFSSTWPTRSNKRAILDIHDRRHTFYNATFGRWVYNEKKRLSERHLYFDIDKLSEIVAGSVGQSSQDIARFTKVAEGGSYRVFDVLFKDKRNVIIRLPYPCAIPQEYGMASEVATMEYLRLHGVPIPKVLAWNSTGVNPLGCEYIIMEKSQGRELEEIWYTMGHEERKSIMEKIVRVEGLLFGIQFPAHGSLFFKNSLPKDIKTVPLPDNDNFCIGRSTEYLWWYHERGRLQANRGPWESTLDLLAAVGQRELEWLENFGEPRFPHEPLYRELYGNKKVNPEDQIDNLRNYLDVVPYVVPQREDWNKPTMRHPDLSPGNLFVNESGEISGVIDWHRTVVLPMFIQARVPSHFQNFGDEASDNFKFPVLPDNFDSLSEVEKEQEMELYRRRQLHYYYLGFSSGTNKAHFRAIGTPSLMIRNQLYDAGGRPWEGDNATLKAQLINLSMSWSQIAPPEKKESGFPIKYSDAEIKQCLEINAEQKDTDAQIQRYRDHFGISPEGWVPAEQYEESKQKIDEMKTYMLEIAETEEEKRDLDENWQFQDHVEIP